MGFLNVHCRSQCAWCPYVQFNTILDKNLSLFQFQFNPFVDINRIEAESLNVNFHINESESLDDKFFFQHLDKWDTNYFHNILI